MRGGRCGARSLLLGATVIAWLVLAWLTTAPDRPSSLGALVAVLPYLAIALAMALRARSRGPAVGLWLAVAALVWWQWPQIRSRFEWIYLIQHVGAFSLLGIGFARSLAAGAEPLITRMARIAQDGPLPPALARYTRGATLAWTLFFAAMCTGSLLLFFLGQMAAWSLLVTLLTPALTAAMFVAEYLVRLAVLPHDIRPGLVDSVRAVLRSRNGAAPPAF